MGPNIAKLIGEYGFPIVAAFGMGYFVYYVWKWATTEVKPVLSQANGTLIALIDRVRMLDNDLIRLNQKVDTVISNALGLRPDVSRVARADGKDDARKD